MYRLGTQQIRNTQQVEQKIMGSKKSYKTRQENIKLCTILQNFMNPDTVLENFIHFNRILSDDTKTISLWYTNNEYTEGKRSTQESKTNQI